LLEKRYLRNRDVRYASLRSPHAFISEVQPPTRASGVVTVFRMEIAAVRFLFTRSYIQGHRKRRFVTLASALARIPCFSTAVIFGAKWISQKVTQILRLNHALQVGGCATYILACLARVGDSRIPRDLVIGSFHWMAFTGNCEIRDLPGSLSPISETVWAMH